MIKRRFLTISAVVVITALLVILAPLLIVVSLLASVFPNFRTAPHSLCLLYTSDAADE